MGVITDNPLLREKRFVFADRHDAGRELAKMFLSRPDPANTVVLAIPAGGVPVGVGIARALKAPFALAIVRKVLIPGTTEAGFGAVAWDGRVLINERLRASLGLTPAQADSAIARTRRNVEERLARFTGGKGLPDLAGKTVIIADDGLASGYTMLAALRSVRALHPGRIIVAVPTAAAASAEMIAREADEVVCANIRSGPRFAVAEAYRDWYDLDEREVIAELGGAGGGSPGGP